MLLVKTTPSGQVEQFPYATQDLRRDKLPTTFPEVIPDWMLADNGVYRVARADSPAHDGMTQVLVRDLAPILIEGAWVIGCKVEDKPQDQAEAAVRSQRAWQLKATDWMALSDSPDMTSNWKAYRQELREVTSQDGFPYSVKWPTEPE
jgi:hypothetical protein